MASPASVQFRVYRNNVEIFRGQLLGATQFSYTPPDTSPALYEVRFQVDGAQPGANGFIGRRSMSLVGHRR